MRKSIKSKAKILLLGFILAGGQILFAPLIKAEEEFATIISKKIICKEPGRYSAWPTITKTKKGDLLVVFSGDRDKHVCPWGKIEMIRSSDEGKTWTDPQIIIDTPIDDRDPGITETKEGTLLVSWNASMSFEGYRGSDRYADHAKTISPEVRERWTGQWIMRSVDGGKTWEDPIKTDGFAIHGPIQLKDGRLLYLTTITTKPAPQLTLRAFTSTNDGKTWHILSETALAQHHAPGIVFYEPHVVETDSGKLVCLIRTSSTDKTFKFLFQIESLDGGQTWTKGHVTPMWGLPPHLIRLKNGWLVVVYGRRKPPYGERACISRDQGETWDIENEIVLSNAPNEDLGYPVSVQLDDGSILTVYYEEVAGSKEQPCIQSTHWKLNIP